MKYDEINFGSRVAEDEEKELPEYFLSTRYWKNLIEGKTDIILGPKGSGKSALYLNLLSKEKELLNSNIYIFKAENPRGDTIFSLFNQITASSKYQSPKIEYLIEQDIIAFWKLYFLTIIVSELKKLGFKESEFNKVTDIFEECGLIPKDNSLKNIFRHVIHYLKQIVTLQFFQPELELDPTGAIKAIKGKISFEELSPKKIEDGFYTLNDLFEKIDTSLKKKKSALWIAIDRLDVAFQEDQILENRALKSLFYVYNSLKNFPNISLKIFLREDIWNSITTDGLREASHIVRKDNISWDENNLFFMLTRRILKNQSICDYFKIDALNILKDVTAQKEIFYRLFPEKIGWGKEQKQEVFTWILEMIKDGNGLYTPRELIHFLNSVNSIQGELVRFGHVPENGSIYSEEAIKKGVREVTRTKFEQTLLAENPQLVDLINQYFRYVDPSIELDWFKENFELSSDNDVHSFCDRFCKAGFLKRINLKVYRIPYIYQLALNIDNWEKN
jgi:hypothetical protein